MTDIIAQTRDQLAKSMATRINEERDRLTKEYSQQLDGVRTCVLDDVLPSQTMDEITSVLPSQSTMLRRTGFRERKYVTAELGDLNPSLRELVYGIASPEVANAVGPIIGAPRPLEVDKEFYNGGVTAMVSGDFMVPHLDNSHDRSRLRRRACVLLFYLTDWDPGYGGSLGLWSQDKNNMVRQVEYRRNRLVILQTSETSWHSVEAITGPNPRMNITTYLYEPAVRNDTIRLTRYAGRPHRPIERAMANADFTLRMTALKFGIDAFVKKKHVMSRPSE